MSRPALTVEQNLLRGDHRLVLLIGEENPERIRALVPDASLLAVCGFDWNEMLSPWPSAKVFKGGSDFGGRAEELIARLREDILPEAAEAVQAERILIAGYSLAGLFSLYAASRLEIFRGAASVSGSLWYPGFTEYLKQHPLYCPHVYLSLGDRESLSKSPVLSSVGTCTEEARKILAQYTDVTCVSNAGGHFEQEAERTAAGIRWLLEQTETKTEEDMR